jgi:quercetin 2,3-dioxygenase
MLYRQARSQYHYKNGPFSIAPNLPGYAIPDHRDHGYGPLARFDDTTLEPGGFVPMHEHRNDEIITYIADGLVRHADNSGARLVASPSSIMVMNAGRGFWHEEGTRPDDPTLHGLQIFVRPHTVDLEPNIQFREIGSPAPRLCLSFVTTCNYTMPNLCAAPKSISRSARAGTPSSIPTAVESMSTGQALKRKRVRS